MHPNCYLTDAIPSLVADGVGIELTILRESPVVYFQPLELQPYLYLLTKISQS